MVKLLFNQLYERIRNNINKTKYLNKSLLFYFGWYKLQRGKYAVFW